MVYRGVHINNLSDAAAWGFLRTAKPALVKIVNPDESVRQMRREIAPAVVMGRIIIPDVSLDPTPTIAAERWYRLTVERMKALHDCVDLWEVPANEVYERPPALGLYAAACARYVELAAADGIKCLVGGFARGCPEPDAFPSFIPALQAVARHGGGFHCHEYFHKAKLDATWQVGRVKRLYDTVPAELRVPVWITEFGLDNGDLPGFKRVTAGWRFADYRSAAEYVADLDAGVSYYEAACPFVQGVALFNVGDGDTLPWRAFDANDAAIRAWVADGPRAVSPVTPPTPRPFDPNPGSYSAGAGFLAEAERRRVQLVSDEIYLSGPRGALSLAVTGGGLLVWTRAGGVKFVSFE